VHIKSLHIIIIIITERIRGKIKSLLKGLMPVTKCTQVVRTRQYLHDEVIAWFDVSKRRVVVVFKRAIHIKLCSVIQFDFNRQAACRIHWRRSYEHGISLGTVYSVQHQINSLIYGHLQCLDSLPPTKRLYNAGVCLYVCC